MGTQHQVLVTATDHFSLPYVNQSVDRGTPIVNLSHTAPGYSSMRTSTITATYMPGPRSPGSLGYRAPGRNLLALVETRNRKQGFVVNA